MSAAIQRHLGSKALLPREVTRTSGAQPRLRLGQPILYSAFSTRRILRNRISFTSKEPGRHRQSSTNPEYPAFSFEALGISRNMKTGIIAVLCVFGTMETWFYCQWAWRWWKGNEEAE